MPIRIYLVWAIFLEQHAKQLISRNGNNQKHGANHANHKHPTQDMRRNPDQGIKHIHAPEHIVGILPQLSFPPPKLILKFYDFFIPILVSYEWRVRHSPCCLQSLFVC